MARERGNQKATRVLIPLTPFPNSRTCQLSWSRRWFSRFEGQVPCSNHAGTILFTNLAFFNYFIFSYILIFSCYFNSFLYFISALKNHQNNFFFLHYFHKMFI